MNNELEELIEKYCMGIQPTDAQMDEIFDKAIETGADSQEVSSYMKWMQNGPTREERLEAERRAKEEAERKEREKAERERRECEEAERRAREKAERQAREKAERERREREEAARRAREKAEQERKEREEAERRAREKAERERKKREEAERKAREEAERKAEYERRMREDPAFARAERKKAKEEAERKAKEEKEEAKRKAKEEAERKAAEKAMCRAVKRAARKEKFKKVMKRVVLPIFIVLLVVGGYIGWEFWDELYTHFGGKSQTEGVLDVQGENITVNGVTFKMVEVKGGTFEMGSESGSDEEKPHSETVSDFMIGETEVTQALWKAVMENNPSKYKGEERPVHNVSWHDCQTFIQRLNQLTGKNFRLPTEAEWEYAARGGHKSKGIYQYAGGHNSREVAWYEQGLINRPHKVKMKIPNELGLYDMSGNVSEWCEDWYITEYYKKNGIKKEDEKVCRGGSYDRNEHWCSVFDRQYGNPKYDWDSRGFRLVLSDEEIPEEEEVFEEIPDEPIEESIINEADVKRVLQSYCDAIVNNDFTTLSQLYAPFVERYQSAYNEDRNKVVNRHRKYDDTFKVHRKNSHIRWESFEMDTLEGGRITAVIVEDYSIDREDKTKNSKFVLEKHFILNEDNQIVSVWDNQLSSSK